ncbi:MAG: 50S ribosomal protein L20 [Candidatus Pacebacteria bacterium]|jgi:large subunit ribosomal protein L20|nr:50S ribosomal protein L20 [Candidatus Paceibacterota bacterium]
MVRVKRSITAKKKRKKALKEAKGFKWSRKTRYRQAKEALMHAKSYQYRDRRRKKRERRSLWQIRINAAVRKENLSYSKFINLLKKKKIEIDRKILSEIAKNHPEIFKKIIETVKEK